MKTILTLNRTGIVRAYGSSHNQCKAEGHEYYEYQLKIECNSILDDNGFIIDHNEIQKQMEQFFFTYMDSCEQLVLDLTIVIHKLITTHNSKIKIYSIYLKLVPILIEGKTQAFIEGMTYY